MVDLSNSHQNQRKDFFLPTNCARPPAHRYVREIDREKRAVWEYRVQGTTDVKTCVPLPDGNVAVLNSQEQAILELESGTGKVLCRIAVPAKGSDHTRYNLLRRASNGNYLVALRDEKFRGSDTRVRDEMINQVKCASTIYFAWPDADIEAQINSTSFRQKIQPSAQAGWHQSTGRP